MFQDADKHALSGEVGNLFARAEIALLYGEEQKIGVCSWHLVGNVVGFGKKAMAAFDMRLHLKPMVEIVGNDNKLEIKT